MRRAVLGLLAAAAVLVGAAVPAMACPPDETPKVVFRVWGDAPRGIKVAYGTGDVERFVPVADTPWRATIRLESSDEVSFLYAWPRRGKAFVELRCSVTTVDGDVMRGVIRGRAYDRPVCSVATYVRG